MHNALIHRIAKATSVLWIVVVTVQAQAWLWREIQIRTDHAYLDQTAKIDASTFLIAGHFSDTLILGKDTLTTSQYSYSPFISKMDLLGNVVWAKKIPSRKFNNLSECNIDIDSAGFIYLIDDFADTAFFKDTLYSSSNQNDLFIIKMDPDGNVQWAFQPISGGTYFYNHVLSVTRDGGFSMATSFYSTSTWAIGGDSRTQEPDYQHLIASFANDRKLIWSALGDFGEYGDQLTQIKRLPDGSTLLSAWDGGVTSNGFRDNYLRKYGPSGGTWWAQQFEGSSVMQFVVDETGSIYVSGTIGLGTIRTRQNSLTFSKEGLFVLKIDSSGNQIWIQGTDKIGKPQPFSIANGQDDNLFLTGTFFDSLIINADTLRNDSVTTQVVMECSKNGSIKNIVAIDSVSTFNYLLSKNDTAFAFRIALNNILAFSNQRLIVSGTKGFQYVVTSNGRVTSAYGKQALYLGCIDPTSRSGIKVVARYPKKEPLLRAERFGNNFLRLAFSKRMAGIGMELTIHNLSGGRVINKKVTLNGNDSSFLLNISDLPNGPYIVSVKANESVLARARTVIVR